MVVLRLGMISEVAEGHCQHCTGPFHTVAHCVNHLLTALLERHLGQPAWKRFGLVCRLRRRAACGRNSVLIRQYLRSHSLVPEYSM